MILNNFKISDRINLIYILIMKKNELKILDCTLRDGGYYNNWDFSNLLKASFLFLASAAIE